MCHVVRCRVLLADWGRRVARKKLVVQSATAVHILDVVSTGKRKDRKRTERSEVKKNVRLEGNDNLYADTPQTRGQLSHFHIW